MSLLTVEEFRKLVPISKASVYRSIESNEIPSVRVAGRVLIPESYVEKLIEKAERSNRFSEGVSVNSNPQRKGSAGVRV
jgi:excisionase family DNA binding protein